MNTELLEYLDQSARRILDEHIEAVGFDQFDPFDEATIDAMQERAVSFITGGPATIFDDTTDNDQERMAYDFLISRICYLTHNREDLGDQGDEDE